MPIHQLNAVDDLHRSTRHGEHPTRPDLLAHFRPMDPWSQPEAFKAYLDAEEVFLSTELRATSLDAIQVLSGSEAPAVPLDLGVLASLLWLCGGVTRTTRVGKETVWWRTAMSAGNLHPIEIYIVGDLAGGGVLHYDPREHALRRVRSLPAGVAPSSGTTLVLTGISFRTCWKYGERGWRHLWWDAGTMLANLLAAASGYGIGCSVRTGFADREVADLLGVDGVDEAPLVLVDLGRAAEVQTSPGAPARAGSPPPAGRFPLVVAAHSASNLDPASVEKWLAGVGADPSTTSTIPTHRLAGVGIEEVIRRRSSTRNFGPDRPAAELLDWALPAACLLPHLDLGPASVELDHFVVVHAVEGWEAGWYRYHPAGGFGRPGSLADTRRTSVGLCLGQARAGEAAYTVFHCCNLERLGAVLGPRGYRVAQLLAGVVAGRLALCAAALGAGATGLTFYDGLVSSTFDTLSEPLLATAVGQPLQPPPPAGQPGSPVQLRPLRASDR